MKEFQKEQATATGKMFKTGADPDLEVRHEVLPLSPLLVNLAGFCLHDVYDRSVQAELWRKFGYLKEQTVALLKEAMADPLSPHEVLQGTAYLYMQRCNFLSAVTTERATGKKADPTNVLLAIFAVAASSTSRRASARPLRQLPPRRARCCLRRPRA